MRGRRSRKKELKYRSEVGYGEEEKQIWQMYKNSRNEQGFFDLKPELNSKQQGLLSSFYRLSQERELQNCAPLPIKDRDIYYFLDKNGSSYPDDLFLTGIHMLDGHYIEQRCA